MHLPKKTLRTAGRRARGFTLLEIVVAVAILAILAGVAVPITSKILNSRARKATVDELQGLSDSCREFFRDTGRLPASLGELSTNPGAAGWTGPYVGAVATDKASGKPAHLVDGWSRDYKLSAAGDVLTLVSPGEDGDYGDAGDVSLQLDVTFVRREETLEQLELINQAIQLYNGQYQVSDPLPASWTLALNKLVAKGFLPAAKGYDVDAWGQAFVETPKGKSPVVKVDSVMLQGAGGGGKGKGGGGSKTP